LSEIGLRTRMLVKDIMSSPVITVDKKKKIDKVAKLMEMQRLGCIVVTEDDGKPIGIITERDLVTRVLAKNKLPSQLSAEEVMTTPLVTIRPDETLSNAARQMSRLNLRRLGVLYKGDLVGIVSSKDILAITPELIETIQEKTRLENSSVEEIVDNPPMAGYCDRCGQWSSRLKEKEGEFLCEDCQTPSQTAY
jgi:CBS domain-containing protein